MRKLINKYQGGGGLASPSSIGQLIQNRDLGIIKQQANLNLSKGLELPEIDNSVIGKSGLFSKANIGNTMNIAGGIADMLGGLIPKKEQSALTTGLNQGYDMAANAVSSIPGVGTIIGGAMKIGGALSDGLTALGIGTDQMTTTDKILDSKFLKLTPLGLINSIGAKKADTMYKDNTTWEQQGSSYGGSLAKVDDAMTKSGKKYGAFSGKGRRAANRQIAEAKRQQGVIQDINNEAQDAFLSSNNSQTIGLRNQMDLNGVNWNKIHAAKEGLKLDRDFAQRVIKLSKGNKSKIRSIGELIEYAKQQNPRFIQRLSEPPRGIKFIDDDGNEVEGSHYLESAGEYVIPRIQEVDGNLKFFNHQDAVNRAIETGNYLKMTPEEAIIFAKEYKQGWPEFFKKFKNGGTVNVIPDGALHKNKHHLENVDEKFEDVTAKGIPVITESAGGDITQHAEVEREEIIFNLDVTKQLEKLMEDGSDEAAIEAGKLLVHEILENTVDNTGLLNKIE